MNELNEAEEIDDTQQTSIVIPKLKSGRLDMTLLHTLNANNPNGLNREEVGKPSKVKATIEMLKQRNLPIWDQLPKGVETAEGYRRFRAWLDLGPHRKLDEAAEVAGVPRVRMAEASGKYGWRERAIAYDNSMKERFDALMRSEQTLAAVQWEERTRDFRQRLYNIGSKMIAQCEDFLTPRSDADTEAEEYDGEAIDDGGPDDAHRTIYLKDIELPRYLKAAIEIMDRALNLEQSHSAGGGYSSGDSGSGAVAELPFDLNEASDDQLAEYMRNNVQNSTTTPSSAS